MTYPDKLEKIVAKKYAFPAFLYSVAMILSIAELFVNFGLSKYCLPTFRLILFSVCVVLLVIFAFMRKNVNFYDVAATALLPIVIIADWFCILSSEALYSVPGRLSTVVDLYPGGIIRYYQVFTSADGISQTFSDHRFAFSFLALFEGFMLIYIAVCTILERKDPKKANEIDKINRKIFIVIIAIAAVAAITFVLVNFLYTAPLRHEKYSPLFVDSFIFRN